MEVIPIDFRDAYAFGGGLHCSTADVYREGNLDGVLLLRSSLQSM